LQSKKAAETTSKNLETKFATANFEREAVELERDSFKEKNAELEEEVKMCKGALVEYFDDGFERAGEQARHFYVEADF
jgi:hypothetical protein